MKYSVAVFSYDFCHKKTQDILIGLYLSGIRGVLVIAAPKIKLNHNSVKKPFDSIKHKGSIHPKDICRQLGYDYQVCPHDNITDIERHVIQNGSNIAIISGARIIKQSVIGLFQYGVINYHPGPLPETSGLDSLFWMIEKNVRAVATAHFIDSRVDAGELIDEYPAYIYKDQDIAMVEYSLYVAQLNLHQNICEKIANNLCFMTTKIYRPSKNFIMTEAQIELSLKKFNDWKVYYSRNH